VQVRDIVIGISITSKLTTDMTACDGLGGRGAGLMRALCAERGNCGGVGTARLNIPPPLPVPAWGLNTPQPQLRLTNTKARTQELPISYSVGVGVDQALFCERPRGGNCRLTPATAKSSDDSVCYEHLRGVGRVELWLVLSQDNTVPVPLKGYSSRHGTSPLAWPLAAPFRLLSSLDS